MEEDRLDPVEWSFESATDPAFMFRVDGDAFPRCVILCNGTILTGNGTVAPTSE